VDPKGPGTAIGLSSDAGLIAQNYELNDFVVIGREVECEHKWVREPTLVEQSVHMDCYDGMPVVLDILDNLESQSLADDVASGPGRDRFLALVVCKLIVDERVIDKRR
jgi:hypothetical protein